MVAATRDDGVRQCVVVVVDVVRACVFAIARAATAASALCSPK